MCATCSSTTLLSCRSVRLKRLRDIWETYLDPPGTGFLDEGFSMHLYEVLKRPITTEKSNRLKDDFRQYAFEVDERANKHQIKEAVENAFNVQVLNVNVMRMARKRRH